MKTKFLSALTIMAAIPSFAFVISFTRVYEAPITHWFVIQKLIIVSLCFIGGILLWRGAKLGYQLSTIGWLTILYESFMSIYVAFQPETKEATRAAMFIMNGIFIMVGIPVLIVLIRDIMKKKKV